MPKIRVLLVDDQPLILTGFSTILAAQDDIAVLGSAANGQEAIDLARELKPDVICMDVQMPVLDGLSATQQIVADPTINSAVLILTTFDREDYLTQALRAGACGYLLKTAGSEQLISAVRSAAAGDRIIAPQISAEVLRIALAGPSAELSPNPQPHPETQQPRDEWEAPSYPKNDLTERELDVLRLLAEGMSNDEIAKKLFVGVATVKTHVSNILLKKQLRDRVQAVVWAYRSGALDQN